MADATARLDVEEIRPNVGHIITEDDAAVDNLPSAKGQRLLVEPLYSVDP